MLHKVLICVLNRIATPALVIANCFIGERKTVMGDIDHSLLLKKKLVSGSYSLPQFNQASPTSGIQPLIYELEANGSFFISVS